MNRAIPRLRRGVRLSHDSTRGKDVILRPEGVVVPNRTATATLRLCDGQRDVTAIVAALHEEFTAVNADEVHNLLQRLAERRIIEWR